MRIRTYIVLCLLITNDWLYGQDTLAVISSRVAGSFISSVGSRTERLDRKLESVNYRALEKLLKLERRIKLKIANSDSAKAADLFSNSEVIYSSMNERLKQQSEPLHYLSKLDTLSTTFKFLQSAQRGLFSRLDSNKLSSSIRSLADLNSRFGKADIIKKFIKERRELLSRSLEEAGLAKELKQLNKQVYYYSLQIKEYKAILGDYKKAERKFLKLVGDTKYFQEFMRKNSILASLFRMPGEVEDPSGFMSLSGLQSRAQVNTLVQQQLSNGGPEALEIVSQNLQQAQTIITNLKNKAADNNVGSSDDILPERFKPNSQRTKSFFQRIEVGFNIQSQKANNLFPIASDLGLAVGYRVTDEFTFGGGVSYRVGWGKNIRHIKITHQGIGIRAFADYKIKGSFWLSGGYENNYRSAFRNIAELREKNSWQASGLVGFSKVISLKTKFFKRTKLQLLWDFLSYDQVPKTQPIVFRIGYSIK